MRRFATWTTGHRKTVLFSWIAALIVIGAISGAVGADFTEEFKLPASDSKEAFDLLETKFPAQSGETSQIVFRADSGVESPAVKKKMEGVFAQIEKFPHVSEVASPYEQGGAAAVSDDGKIAYATIQSTSPTTSSTKKRRGKSSRSPRAREATASKSSSAATRFRKPNRKKATPRS